MTQVQIWLTVATVIGVNIGFILGCIWATGRTLDKVQDWKCREAIRNGEPDGAVSTPIGRWVPPHK